MLHIYTLKGQMIHSVSSFVKPLMGLSPGTYIYTKKSKGSFEFVSEVMSRNKILLSTK